MNPEEALQRGDHKVGTYNPRHPFRKFGFGVGKNTQTAMCAFFSTKYQRFEEKKILFTFTFFPLAPVTKVNTEELST